MKTKFLLRGVSILILVMFMQISTFSQEYPIPDIYDINPSGSTYPAHFADLNGTIYFGIYDEIVLEKSSAELPIYYGLYRIFDGAYDLVIGDPNWHSITSIAAIGDYVYFGVDHGAHDEILDHAELWRTDGETSELVYAFEGPELTKFGNTFKHEEMEDLFVWLITEMDGFIYFAAYDPLHGGELWKSDGLPGGTTEMVKDLTSGSASSAILEMMAYDGHLYLNAGIQSDELWISDGTEEGTMLQKDFNAPPMVLKSDDLDLIPFNPDYPETQIEDFVVMGSNVYFHAVDEFGARDLWMTNSSGPTKVMTYPSGVVRLVVIDEVLYFSAYLDEGGIYGARLWKYDGTDLVKIDDGMSGEPNYYDPKRIIKAGDDIYFSANDGIYGREQWVTDGVTSHLLKDIYVLGGGDDGDGGDGGGDGDCGVMEDDPDYIPPLNADPNPRNAITLNEKLFFSAALNDGNGYEIWRSDGTEEGTVQVTDIYPGSGVYCWVEEEDLMVAGNVFYFNGDDGINGRELRSFNVLHFTELPESPIIAGLCLTDFTLTAVAEGHGEVSYQWQKDGEDIEGATSSTLVFPAITYDHAGTYNCIANDLFYGDYKSDDIIVDVEEIIEITEQPAAFTAICEWEPQIMLSIVAWNPCLTEVSYQWYKDGGIIYGATESTFSILNNPYNSGIYTCTVSGDVAVAVSEEAVVVINANTDITKHPVSQENIEEGADVTFLVLAEGTNLRYQWRKDGVNLSNGGNIEGVDLPIMIIHGVTADDEGYYDCAVIGQCLVMLTQPAALTVLDTEDDGATTSLDELAKEGISVFPNPSSGRFAIQFKEVTNEVVINIYDLTGKAVYTNTAKADYFDIDISEKPSGIYILRMEFDNKIIYSKIILE